MIQTNSEPFQICEYCQILRRESEFVPVHVHDEDGEKYKDEICEECASQGEDEDGYHANTRNDWQTQRNRNLRIAIEYLQSLNMQAKYSDTKDTALRRHIVKVSKDCYNENFMANARMTHQYSMRSDIALAIIKRACN